MHSWTGHTATGPPDGTPRIAAVAIIVTSTALHSGRTEVAKPHVPITPSDSSDSSDSSDR